MTAEIYDERSNCCNGCGRQRPRGHEPGCRYANGAPPTEIKEQVGTGRRLVLTAASDIEPEPVTWAWEDAGQGRIPAGSLGLGAGREGTGKSSHAIWMAARVTSGTLPGSFQGHPRPVIYVAVEDSWKFTIVPRLIAAGANLDLVLQAEVRIDEDETTTLSLPVDNKQLETAITAHDVGLVVLDPLMSAISANLDTHRNREVRRALDPLAGIAERTGAVVWGICHFSKGNGTDASSLITGSGAFKDVARAILAFARDEEDGTQVITQTKNSLGRLDLPSLAYRIIAAKVETKRGTAEVGKFVLEGETDRRVQDILSDTGEDRAEKKSAKEFLADRLAAGPQRSKDIEQDAREGYSISARTLARARKELGVKAEQLATGKDGRNEWWLSLPTETS